MTQTLGMKDGDEFFSEDEDFWLEWNEYEEDAQVDEKNEYFRTICYFCDKRFTSVKKRFQHEKVCNFGSSERFSCKVCKLNFRLEQGLERHKKRHDLPGGFPCRSCDDKFVDQAARSEHKNNFHRNFRCQICESVFNSESTYVNHIVQNHSNCKCWLLELKDEKERDKFCIVCKMCGYDMTNISEGLKERTYNDNPPQIQKMESVESDELDDDPILEGMNGDTTDEIMSEKSLNKSGPTSFPSFNDLLQEESSNEGLDLDDDMPLSQLKSQITAKEVKKFTAPPPSLKRQSPRKCKNNKDSSKKTEQISGDDSECVDFFDMSSMIMEDSPKVKSDSDNEDEYEIQRRYRPRQIEPQTQKLPEFKCPHCPQIYIFQKRYIAHLKSEHGVEPPKKLKCRESRRLRLFDDCFQLGYRKHGCSQCKRRFATKEALAKHEECHGDDGKLKVKCTLCNELFDDESMIKQHKKTAHKDEVTCTYCKKTYAGERNLQTHIELRHTKTRSLKRSNYLCGKCGKNFTSKTALLDHERSDCGKSPIYQCDVCKKFYHSAGSLKGHKTLHTKEKPFLCKYCGKGFRNAGQLRVHERIHTGEKPYKCTYCPKAFSHKETLLTHLTVHTGYKRFMCSGCGKRFACISNLQVHRKAHSSTCGLIPNCTRALKPYEVPVDSVMTEDD